MDRCSLTRCLAASATPCAWLPAEEQITPLARCSSVKSAILLYAPRSLKDFTCEAPRARVAQRCRDAVRRGAIGTHVGVGRVVLRHVADMVWLM
jgi:hypothetical protein